MVELVLSDTRYRDLFLKPGLLRPELDGSQGANRGVGRQQIEANRDWDAIQVWLSQFEPRSHTYAAYEKEVRRFYLWVLVTLNKPLSSLVLEDWRRYLEFLKNPQPAEFWLSNKKSSRASLEYRPFSKGLADQSRGFTQAVIHSLFKWMRDVGYLAGVPIQPDKKLSKKPAQVFERFLEDDLWQTVLSTVEGYQRDTEAQIRRYAQARWLISLFYLSAIRTSEALTATMGDIHSVLDRNHDCVRYFLKVTGKGDKERRVPVSEIFIQELCQYRLAFGLSKLPEQRETTPLILSLQTKSKFKQLTRQALYAQLKGIFLDAAESLQETDPDGARKLESASTHWLRHTAATEMLNNGTNPRTVQGVLGHASLSTTGIYSHTEDLKLHRELDGRRSLTWGET